MKHSPAKWVIHVFNHEFNGHGVAKLSSLLGLTKQAVHSWQHLRKKRGVRGLIPNDCQRQILRYAKAHNLDITEHDIIWGRET